MQRPYWQEYFWAGHEDKKEYIHFIFKFGRGVDEQFNSTVIRAVTETAQQ
jgi:5-carboxymethyl-2-hydroxymuconate isomerase